MQASVTEKCLRDENNTQRIRHNIGTFELKLSFIF